MQQRTLLLIVLGSFLVAAISACQKSNKLEKTEELHIQGHVKLKKNNAPIENATITIIRHFEVEEKSLPTITDLSPSTTTFKKTEVLMAANTDAKGYYDISTTIKKKYFKLTIDFDRDNIVETPLSSCAYFTTNDIQDYELDQNKKTIDYWGKNSQPVLLNVYDASCSDSSLLKYCIIGNYKEDGSEDKDLSIIGDRSCETLKFTSEIKIPGFIKWSVEKNGQVNNYIDSFSNIDNCSTIDFEVAY